MKKLTQDLARRKHIRSKDGIMGYGLSESFVSYVKRKEKKKTLFYFLELCFLSEKKKKKRVETISRFGTG